MHSKKSIYFLLFITLISVIQADKIKENTNKNYIISIKDSSKYSFDIQPSKPEESKFRKKDEIPKFNSIDFNELEQIINSNDCAAQLNSNDTSLCNLSMPTNSLVAEEKGNKSGSNSINIEELEKKLKPKKSFVNQQMKELAELILDNIDTYDNDSLITKEIHSIIHKRSTTSLDDILNNKAFSKILKKSYNILDVTVIYAYLSVQLYEIIKDLPNVVEIIEDFEIKFPQNPDKQYYNITDIKVDTKWDDVLVDENTYSHLSLISQSKVDFNLIGKYDTNYYYPSSAGAGVDIYIIDSGIYTDHVDFDTTDRTVTCEGIAVGDTFTKFAENDERRKTCYSVDTENYIYHGSAVASAAAGSRYGVARKANIHVIAMSVKQMSYIGALMYIYNNAKNPHKTIINISSGSYKYVGVLDKTINMLTRKGFMIITSAGNDGIDACTTEVRYSFDFGDVNEKYYPASYIDTISVGSISNYDDIEITPARKVYESALFSNFGECIDIYAPGYAYLARIPRPFEEGKFYSDYLLQHGTSFSSPIIAGVAALLVSEHPEITFNQEKLRKMLLDLSIKNIIGSLNSMGISNNFVNIGKKVVYSSNEEYMGCGIHSGKMSCSDDQCCSIDGYCGKTEIYCDINCQSEFGRCSPNNTPSGQDNTSTEGEYKNNFIYNYWNDLCLKFSPENYITNNLILTKCEKTDEDSIWYISSHGDSKFIEDYYVDVCVNVDENNLAYAYHCDSGTVFKDIITSSCRDSIQSEAYPGKCLKPVVDDYVPYGITIFTENIGLRVKMDDCNDDDEYQRWRINNVLDEIPDDEYYGYQKRDKIASEDKNEESTDLVVDVEDDDEENVTASLEADEDSEFSNDNDYYLESEDDNETTSQAENIKKAFEKETTIVNNEEVTETISINNEKVHDKETTSIDDNEVHEKETTSIDNKEIHEKETTSIDDKEVHEEETTSIDDNEVHEKETTSIDNEEKETISINDEMETDTVYTTYEGESSSINNEIKTNTVSTTYEEEETTASEQLTYYETEYEVSTGNPNETEYITEYITEPSDIFYNNFGEVFYREDYIPCNYYEARVTNTKSVWIYNKDLNLCLTAMEKSKHQARLIPCDSENEYQKWLIPDDNEGYYVNKKDNSISIIYSQNSLVIAEYIEVIQLERIFVKNHSSIIFNEDENLVIYDPYTGEKICFNIQEKEKSKKTDVLVDIIACEESNSHWKLTTKFPVTTQK
ncbi:carbohydrate-binding module family 18 protein [Piromyces sp. E2]|nr:carbohydrate-binding module family 18 protein [Piromyces sp. E2]|eukprot:OUM60888.1 carbohydrate-binding module family 18 protein [Piromyces sp. E2]